MPTLRAAGRTDTGRSRSRNEDAYHVDGERGLAVVADGMGGHPAGDRASQLAVREVVERLGGSAGGGTPAHDDPGSPPPSRPESDTEGRDVDMAKTVRAANQRILRDGQDHPERQGMGTTLTVLHADAETSRYRIGHVGDSRCYLFRNGELVPLTRDHTPLQREVDAGRISREQARVHPMGHMLSQALGTASPVEPQVADGAVEPGDLFLLCTDGLIAVLSEEEIASLIRGRGAGDPDELARALVDRTLEGGAPDNVTVALLLATPE